MKRLDSQRLDLQDYADKPHRNSAESKTLSIRRGIIRRSALCPLCRYRHNGHWTRHPTRLDRNFGRKRWGDEGYAMEELVAELGSAFLGADLGLKPNLLESHASYIESWLEVLKKDKKAIFTASGHASRAAELLNSKQPGNP